MKYTGEECSLQGASPKLSQMTEIQNHEVGNGLQENRDNLNVVHSSCILILEHGILPQGLPQAVCLMPGLGLTSNFSWGLVNSGFPVFWLPSMKHWRYKLWKC